MTQADFDRAVANFRRAVGQDCMGAFCAQYGIGKLEWECQTSLELIRKVAEWLEKQEPKPGVE